MELNSNVSSPLIGGSLANPAEKYSHIFESIAFLTRYPYFLPCFFSGIVALLSAISAFFFLHEVRHFFQPQQYRPLIFTRPLGAILVYRVRLTINSGTQ